MFERTCLAPQVETGDEVRWPKVVLAQARVVSTLTETLNGPWTVSLMLRRESFAA